MLARFAVRLPLASRSFFSGLLLAVAAGATGNSPRLALAPEYQQWLAEVEPILTRLERFAFSELQRDYQRDLFIEEFWRQRDAFRPAWDQRRELALELFGELGSDRARTLLLIGPPEMILADLCPELARPMEAWFFGGSEGYPEGFYLIFVPAAEDDPATKVHWPARAGIEALFRPSVLAQEDLAKLLPQLYRRCSHGREMAQVLASQVTWEQLREAGHLLPPEPSDWTENFRPWPTDVVLGTPPFDADLRVSFPGFDHDRIVTQLEIRLQEDGFAGPGQEAESAHLQLDGELLRADHLHDRFRYHLDVPLIPASSGGQPMVLQRHVLPGEYTLILRLADLDSGRAFRTERPLVVPLPEDIEPSVDTALAEANAVLAATDHSIHIQPLSDQLLTGRVRVQAETQGEGIERVAFLLNGQPTMSKTRPPYSIEIDLGSAPRLHTLEAVALDATGAELARDLVPINGGPHRFAVRLLEPRSDRSYVQSLRAVARVDLPDGEQLERLDIYLNERRLASLFQPPYILPMILPENERIVYVRAVAYLEDGYATEDLVFLNAPPSMGRLRINMVELYTTVTDRRGRPVEGLTREAFTVREEGEEHPIRRFERVQDLPIHAGVILDASTSMSEEIEEAIDGALRFFDTVIEAKDRATAVTFNDEPVLEVPFTNESEVLAAGLEDVRAEGETALYDSLVFTLHYFSGIRGKKALVLLSDGEDSKSRYSFEETLEFAQRSGVAVYSIALGLDRRRLAARNALVRLANETGGRFFSIDRAQELGDIYREIEAELRSQYLLVYQSRHEDGGDYRRVEVEVDNRSLKARTVPGYYP